jgi:hypothetical protein
MTQAQCPRPAGIVVLLDSIAVIDRRFGRGFGLIDDDLHALVERSVDVDNVFDAGTGERSCNTDT